MEMTINNNTEISRRFLDIDSFTKVLKNIKVVVDRVEIFTCKMSSFCKQSFLNVTDYRLHEISHTQKDVKQTLFPHKPNGKYRFIKRFKCKECGLKFVQSNTLTAHSILHEPFAHVCDCGIGFYQRTDLILHKQLVHRPKLKWESKINLKPKHIPDTNILDNKTESVKLQSRLSTTVPPTITVDLKTVSEKMPTNENNQFYCPICNKILASKRNLRIHLITHTEEKPYKCDKCNKGYVQNKSLIIHQKKHMDTKKDFKCKFCNKVFYSLSLLQSHELTHTGEKPYVCSYCEKTFSTRATMNRHLRIHTGDKIKQCHVCMKLFYSPYELKRHLMTVHDKVKRFECDVCNKKFPEKPTLIKHYNNIHLGIKKYKCDYCGLKQANKNNLKTHILRMHMNNQHCIDDASHFFKNTDFNNYKHFKGMNKCKIIDSKCIANDIKV